MKHFEDYKFVSELLKFTFSKYPIFELQDNFNNVLNEIMSCLYAMRCLDKINLMEIKSEIEPKEAQVILSDIKNTFLSKKFARIAQTDLECIHFFKKERDVTQDKISPMKEQEIAVNPTSSPKEIQKEKAVGVELSMMEVMLKLEEINNKFEDQKEINKKLEESDKNQKEINKKLEESDKNQKEINKKLERLNKKLEESDKNQKEKIKKLEESDKNMKEEIKKLEESNKSQKEKIKKLEESHKNQKEKIKKLEEWNFVLQQDVDSLKKIVHPLVVRRFIEILLSYIQKNFNFPENSTIWDLQNNESLNEFLWYRHKIDLPSSLKLLSSIKNVCNSYAHSLNDGTKYVSSIKEILKMIERVFDLSDNPNYHMFKNMVSVFNNNEDTLVNDTFSNGYLTEEYLKYCQPKNNSTNI